MYHSHAQYSLILRLLHTSPSLRSDEQIRQLMEITQGIKFFSSLSKAVHEACCRVMKCAEYRATEVVFSFGDEPDSFCVVLKGAVAVGVPTWTTMLANKLVRLPTLPSSSFPEKRKGTQGVLSRFLSQGRAKTLVPRMRPPSPKAQLSPELNEVTTLGIGSSFGELGLLRGEKRAATITCKEPTTLAVLSKADFDTILRENQAKLLNEKINFLMSVPAFAQWSQAMMSKGSYYFNERSYVKGEVVYREGDPALEIYVVVEGEFMVNSRQFTKAARENGDTEEPFPVSSSRLPQVQLLIKARKEMFGDLEVLEDVPRETTCQCASKRAHVLVASKTVRPKQDFQKRLQNMYTVTYLLEKGRRERLWMKERIAGLLEVEKVKRGFTDRIGTQ